MTAAEKKHILEKMIRARRFQQAALKQYQIGMMGGFLMLDIGQESIAATVRTVMQEEDLSVCGQRRIGAAVAAGEPFRTLLAEFCGRQTGCSHGKSRALSLFSP